MSLLFFSFLFCRIAVLTISVFCVFFTVALAAYMFHNRKIKVFKVASPIFLMICLVGCGIMYLEMAAIFPILDMYACIATKWTRHMGKHWLKVFHSIIGDREQI